MGIELLIRYDNAKNYQLIKDFLIKHEARGLIRLKPKNLSYFIHLRPDKKIALIGFNHNKLINPMIQRGVRVIHDMSELKDLRFSDLFYFI